MERTVPAFGSLGRSPSDRPAAGAAVRTECGNERTVTRAAISTVSVGPAGRDWPRRSVPGLTGPWASACQAGTRQRRPRRPARFGRSRRVPRFRADDLRTGPPGAPGGAGRARIIGWHCDGARD
eukprot:759286-Hanusia_phi.AAC.1